MRRREMFGTKSDAYKAAGVNSATWDRIEAGDPVREDRLMAAIRALWPESGGDWTAIGADRGQLGEPVFAGDYGDPQYIANIENWIFEIVTRVEALEAFVARQAGTQEQEGGSHDDLADQPEKMSSGPFAPPTQADMTRAARHANVPDKED